MTRAAELSTTGTSFPTILLTGVLALIFSFIMAALWSRFRRDSDAGDDDLDVDD